MRKLAWFAAPFSTAVFLIVYLVPRSVLLPIAIGLLALFFVLLLLAIRKRRQGILALCLAAAGMAMAFFWCANYEQQVMVPAETLYGQTLRVTVQILDWPKETDYGISVEGRLVQGVERPLNVMLYLDEAYIDLEPGDQIETVVRLTNAGIIMGEQNDYYTSVGISLKAVGYGPVTKLESSHSLFTLARKMAGSVRAGLERCFPEDVAPVIQALVTGDKGKLDDKFYTALKRSGLAHTVAVSGMHVMFLVGMLHFLLRHRKRAAVISILVIVFFALMVGLTPSVMRASIMQILLLLAPLVDRDYDSPTALSLVLMMLLLQNPYAAASVGLQLSFASVIGILSVATRLRGWLCEMCHVTQNRKRGLRDKLLDGVFSSVSVSLGAMLFTAPLTAIHFGSVSLIAPVSNLLTLWAVTLAFVFGLLAGGASLFLPLIGTVVGLPAQACVRFLQWAVSLLAKLPFASLPISSAYLVVWLILAYGLILWSMLFRRAKCWKRWTMSAALCMGTLFLALGLHAGSYADGAMTLSALDVGQGQSLLLQIGSGYGVVDCGGLGEDAGEIAADYLEGLSRWRLDFLIVTHYHDDHANGVTALLDRVKVERIFLPDVEEDAALRQEILLLAEMQGCEVHFVTADTELQLGSGTVTIYPPLGSGDTNELGLSVLVEADGFKSLITGDMGADVERKLLHYAELPDLDLLVVGHHGSKYATSEELLEQTSPEYAMISVGYNNFGHPADEVLWRLEEAGTTIYRTDLDGTVTIHVGT